jgi:hypothetical protein
MSSCAFDRILSDGGNLDVVMVTWLASLAKSPCDLGWLTYLQLFCFKRVGLCKNIANLFFSLPPLYTYTIYLFFVFVIYIFSFFRVNSRIVSRRLPISFLSVLFWQHDWKRYGNRRGTFYVLIGNGMSRRNMLYYPSTDPSSSKYGLTPLVSFFF